MSSIITKKRISRSFKALLEKESFDKISIVDIMENANIRRQTFYNHFLDKYQLLDWIFQNDLKEHITDNLDFISGKQLLRELFLYFEHHRYFYKQLFEITGQNNFSSYFIEYCQIVVTKIFKEYSRGNKKPLEQTFYMFHLDYHARALAEIFKSYVKHTIEIPNLDFLIIEITRDITLGE